MMNLTLSVDALPFFLVLLLLSTKVHGSLRSGILEAFRTPPDDRRRFLLQAQSFLPLIDSQNNQAPEEPNVAFPKGSATETPVAGNSTANLFFAGRGLMKSRLPCVGTPTMDGKQINKRLPSKPVLLVIANPVAGPPVLIVQRMTRQDLQEARVAGEHAFTALLAPPSEVSTTPLPITQQPRQQTTEGKIQETPLAPIQPVLKSQQKRVHVATEQTAQEAIQKPGQEAIQELAQEAVQKPAQVAVQKPTQEAIPKPAQEAIAKPAQEAIPKPAQEAIEKPAQEAIPKPAQEAIPKPAQEAIPKPAQEAIAKLAQSETQGIIQRTTQPEVQLAAGTPSPKQIQATHPTPQKLTQKTSQVATEETAQEAVQSAPQTLTQEATISTHIPPITD